MSAALASAGACSGALADTDDGVSAVWTAKEVRFVYQGFTSSYSCDGLQDKIRRALLLLGARKDLTVSPTGCSGGFGRVSPFPGVAVKMNVLLPVTEKTVASTQPLVAQWKNVDLAARRDLLDAAGDCELIEQIKQTFVPLFTTRNVEYSSTCIPHQLQVGGVRLKADVLVTNQDTKAPQAPAAVGVK